MPKRYRPIYMKSQFHILIYASRSDCVQMLLRVGTVHKRNKTPGPWRNLLIQSMHMRHSKLRCYENGLILSIYSSRSDFVGFGLEWLALHTFHVLDERYRKVPNHLKELKPTCNKIQEIA